ncbi:MAG: M28 family metallopeptidase [Acidobacteria bacterium]|nr:M28 family metallopeptidase [Acidobacteriota bacterium]
MGSSSRLALLVRVLASCILLADFARLPSGRLDAAVPTDASIMGFTPIDARLEFAIESKLKSFISSDSERRFHRYLTAEPHPAGSARNNDLARWIARQWRWQGLEDITIHRYDVLNSFPREVSVEMVTPLRYQADLREAAYREDPDTANPRVHSSWFSMSASGEVTAPVVYAHTGNPEDYELLRKQGIDVKGKVVLVRYSNPYSYRGFKALTAQQLGAAAILIYSDPAEDGYKKGAVFPDGPWGPETHIQRGAVTYDFIVPGDPTTPGWASLPGAQRISPDQARSVPKIIAVPLSWHDARPLLEHLGGPFAPTDWQGGLPFEYHLGGDATVHVKVQLDTRIMPNYVVEGRIRGSEVPDQWVILGNHRDAWEFGGVDPSSGTASMLELTSALGRMLRQGLRPRRTLVFCSWDGEEVGLTGSTEWGEQFADQIKHSAIAYLNVDSSTSGPDFDPSAVPSLAKMLVEVSRAIADPSGRPLHDAWMAAAARERKEAGEREPVTDANLVNTRIGSGSDHTVFLNFLGRPTMELQFNGPYGVYHSMYDDFYWMNHFGDPGYKYHALMSELWGTIALRLANAQLLPLDFVGYAENIRKFLEEVQKKPAAAEHVNFIAALRQADRFKHEAEVLDERISSSLASGVLARNGVDTLNRRLMSVELNWLNPDGIPGRPWFKHVIYAARYTYAHLELPGITEAVENGDWQTAQEQLRIVENALARNTELLRRANSEFVAQVTPAPVRR